MKPKLLLHICCGPCATSVVLRLKEEYEVVGYFCNPNIAPTEEYYRRFAEVERLKGEDRRSTERRELFPGQVR